MPDRNRNHEMIALECSMTLSGDKKAAEIMVYGVIVSSTAWQKKYGLDSEDRSAADFDKAIKEAKDSGAKTMNVRINSPGGVVNQAVAMRRMLMGSQFDELVIDIDGVCASAATLLCCIPNARVRMAEGSEYMIHNPRNGAWGTAEEVESIARRLRVTESAVRDIYVHQTGKDEATVKDWMDKETSFTAQQAVDAGFADEVYKGEQVVACVSPRMMQVMQEMYGHIPEGITVMEAQGEGVSPRQPVRTDNPSIAAGVSTEDNNNSEEDTGTMDNENKPGVKDVKTMTLEELRAENPALFDSVMKSGGEEERQRMQEIDDLTPVGYEDMAAEAKKNGTSAMDFHKSIVKAQREKGQAFVMQRKAETAPGAAVPGAASEETGPNANAEMTDKAAKDVAAYAAAYLGVHSSMY